MLGDAHGDERTALHRSNQQADSASSLACFPLILDAISYPLIGLDFDMRSFRFVFFKFYHRSSSFPKRTISSSPIMSSSGTAAALYAATVSPASVMGAVPEEAKDKKHHLQNGKGFTNPWDSWTEMSGPAIGWAMIKYIWYIRRLADFSS